MRRAPSATSRPHRPSPSRTLPAALFGNDADAGDGARADQSPRSVPRATLVLVTAEAERLTEEALKLSKEERLHLLTVLADSIEEGSVEEIEAAWVAEAKRRLAGIESGERPTVSWEDVEQRLLSR
jgi:putative addiction module component (TIGR02574 family)